MFTLDQIKAAHAKVKSGADFPQYVQDLKKLGIVQYSQYVADGHTIYNGIDYELAAPSKYEDLIVANTGNAVQLQHHLKIHQAGETNYLTFCGHAAEDGVEKWTVDIINLTCTYYDKARNAMITEVIPQPRQL
ncbi:DUF1398 domain-containing protein [Flavobacterium psychrotrophum]|uniref:DUF1398 domain-containing protein n=1 Tax=Flavobacterium psychrotrophum TaxID=2294119 RepID=UPI000E31F593|nr:DUF1398 family protein [Flavobacterium psychrotrophum]